MHGQATTPFPSWKFRGAVLPDSLEPVPLVARLDAALERVPFVSIVAPAGSGKTTALSGWAARDRSLRPLWVRLDAQDDDPVTLAAVLQMSIEQNLGNVPARLDGLLRSTSKPAIHQLATAIALDLEESERVALILDDFHHLRAADSVSLIGSLLLNMGPSCRLVAASRVEPAMNLAELRVRRQVTEFGTPDLRLERKQVAALLADLGADDGLAETILERSRGWAAAVVLQASSFAARGMAGPDAEAALLAAEGDIDDYLRTEVLDQLGPEVRDFVLESSLLDFLDVSGCTAVTGTERAGALLGEVRRLALVERVVADADPGGTLTLRYHDRIRAFLRKELAASRTSTQLVELHRRAAEVSSPMHAVELLLEIGDIERAGAIVAEAGRIFLETPGLRVPRSWLIPFEKSHFTSQPWLAVLSGLAALEDGDIARAVAHLAPAVGEMRSRGDVNGLLRSAYGLAEAHLAWGHTQEAGALIDELLGLDTTPDERVKVLAAKLWLDYFAADWDAIGTGLDQAFNLALTSCGEQGRCEVALALGTEFVFAPAGVRWLSDRAAELARRIDRDVMALTSLELVQAAAELVCGRIDAAGQIMDGVDERALELGNLNWLGLAADRVHLGLALATGDNSSVDATVDAARRVLAESDRHHQERAMYAYALARTGQNLAQPDRVRAARIVLGEVSPEDRPDTVVTAGVLDAWLQCAQGDLAGAEQILREMRPLHHRIRFCLLTGLVDLELASVLLSQDRVPDAREVAGPALARLARMGGIGLIVIDGPRTHEAVLQTCRDDPQAGGFAVQALAALGAQISQPGLTIPTTGERLTSREFEVLERLMAGDSNREIAENLFISVRTVKSHMTSIMRKLDVTSRTAAIARIRELGIT